MPSLHHDAAAGCRVIPAPGPAPASRRLVITCDHASNALPAAYRGLGLPAARLDEHIAWDIGAAALSEALARRLAAPAILSGWSRLLIDCNRDPAEATSIPPVSDGIVIPGNQAVDATEAARRAVIAFHPYHDAVTAELAARPRPFLLSLHSFTPRMDGFDRPWQVGVLWNRGEALAQAALAALRALPGITVGDNQPYCAKSGPCYSLDRHAGRHRRDSLVLEVRQDEIADPAGVASWAARLEPVVAGLLGE